MKVWTVMSIWDEGASEDVAVFSSKDKVYNYIRSQLDWRYEEEKESKPYALDSLSFKYKRLIEAMDKTFLHDYTIFSIEDFYCEWSVCETEIDAEVKK